MRRVKQQFDCTYCKMKNGKKQEALTIWIVQSQSSQIVEFVGSTIKPKKVRFWFQSFIDWENLLNSFDSWSPFTEGAHLPNMSGSSHTNKDEKHTTVRVSSNCSFRAEIWDLGCVFRMQQIHPGSTVAKTLVLKIQRQTKSIFTQVNFSFTLKIAVLSQTSGSRW